MPALMVATGNETTIKNLLAAYAGESNTRAQYKAFATQADAEGLPGIASLFRAAARAEQIHAGNQARVLRQMSAEARAEVSAVKVRSTLENLRTALAGEKYEIEEMYPDFIAEATAHIEPDRFTRLHMGPGSRKDSPSSLQRGNSPGRSLPDSLLDQCHARILRLPGLRLHLRREAGRELYDLWLPFRTS